MKPEIFLYDQDGLADAHEFSLLIDSLGTLADPLCERETLICHFRKGDLGEIYTIGLVAPEYEDPESNPFLVMVPADGSLWVLGCTSSDFNETVEGMWIGVGYELAAGIVLCVEQVRAFFLDLNEGLTIRAAAEKRSLGLFAFDSVMKEL